VDSPARIDGADLRCLSCLKSQSRLHSYRLFCAQAQLGYRCQVRCELDIRCSSHYNLVQGSLWLRSVIRCDSLHESFVDSLQFNKFPSYLRLANPPQLHTLPPTHFEYASLFSGSGVQSNSPVQDFCLLRSL